VGEYPLCVDWIESRQQAGRGVLIVWTEVWVGQKRREKKRKRERERERE